MTANVTATDTHARIEIGSEKGPGIDVEPLDSQQE